MINLDSITDPRGGLVPPAIYTDPDLYQLELENVFGRSWMFLAHESQLPKPGNFIQTYMAEDPVLVVRQRDGSVMAFLNQCRHRGMRICRTDAGTAKTFTCTYHGWAYDLQGNLISVPGEDPAYHNELDKARWSPHKVPRIANYRGFYFGCWSESTPEFHDYIGDMVRYFDATLDAFDGGLELVPGTSKWVIDCNWKFASEQFASDMYHAAVSHASVGFAMFEDLPQDDDSSESPYARPGRQVTRNGHGTGSVWLNDIVMPIAEAETGPVHTQWLRENQGEVIGRVGDLALKARASHNTIFPNFSWLGLSSTMRVWHPRGPGQIEVWAWTYVPKDAPAKVKDAIRYGTQRSFSPAGVFETDDGENWNEIQRVLRGWKARSAPFNVQMGLGHDDHDVPGYPGRSNHMYSEMAARGFYQRWADLVRGLSWAEIAELDRQRDKEEEVPAR